ncbi:tetratricopeptide repeat protein [Massilia sp. Root351]|jgi:tetratricopeptide (TPR) repeat protein|uniref:tetratricopeptide repeat protein n=1 Tax=Massilia sp. Root351 TaxID=1736522 RepID=UPI000AA61945|nr:tetratricopeptide repeat protein [Massilia sp. Root351]
MLRKLAFALILGICAARPAGAELLGNAESQKLVSEGHALQAAGKYKEALDKFEAARKLSPEASSPLSSAAYLLQMLLPGLPEDAAGKARRQAEGLAREALKLAANDPLAAEVLRMLEDPMATSGYKPNAEADKAYTEGEVLFHQGQYEAARVKYREAQLADPKFSAAFLMEGDTYFMEKNWLAAEMLFNKATQVDPQNAQAWRFLADTLARLGNRAGLEHAALHAVAAQPSQMPSWDRLAAVARLDGKPLTRLQVVRLATVSLDPKTGKATISLAEQFKGAKVEDNSDYAVWLAYALAQANALTSAAKEGRTLSPFALEQAGWSTALKVAGELQEKGAPPLASPVLLTLRGLKSPADLEAAILLLMYREAYRPELEAWKKARPDGIRDFVAAYRLMP